MARVRVENRLNSWDDVNACMREIGKCQVILEHIEGEMNAKINNIKAAAEKEAKPLQERIERLGLQIKDFVEMHRDEIKGKTKELNFGFTGFRHSTKILIKNIKSTIAALKAKGMTDCLKITESILKDKLKDYPEDVIVSVGATKKVEDVFWYEINRERLKAN